ncbi:MAG: response regulator [Candidatus Pacebacteria bacterium]|nr:response regulator [Candidatus Paceibacterota bacterium]
MDTNNKKKVLVIDDDGNLRNVLLDALTSAGFESEGAADGEEGLRMAFETHPDVIMLDVMMPKMNGWQMLDKLRMDDWGMNARVIMLTSLGQMENIAEAVDKKVLTYIVKSDLDLKDIASTIQSAINSQLVKP